MKHISKRRFLKSFRTEERGNVSMMFAIGFSAVGILVGSAIDFSILSSKKQNLQDALDAATLYAAKMQDTPSFEVHARQQLKNQIDDVNLKSMSSSFELEGSNVVGTINATAKLNFAGFLNRDAANISVRSVVSLPSSGGPCIILLDPNRNPALTLNSGAQVDASDCDVHVHSAANHAVMVNSGSSLVSPKVCVKGGINVNYGGTIEEVEPDCTPMADPYAGKIPAPDDSSCDFNATNYNGGYVRLTPGVYCGWFAFQGSGMNVEMDPGLYVLKNGGWSFNGGPVKGEGVTIYYGQNSTINFNSSIDVDLSAPTYGTYTDILMAEAISSNKVPLNLNDADGYDFEGVIYLPNRNLTLNSGANIKSSNVTIIANTLMINDVSLAAESLGSGGNAIDIYISR